MPAIISFYNRARVRLSPQIKIQIVVRFGLSSVSKVLRSVKQAPRTELIILSRNDEGGHHVLLCSAAERAFSKSDDDQLSSAFYKTRTLIVRNKLLAVAAGATSTNLSV